MGESGREGESGKERVGGREEIERERNQIIIGGEGGREENYVRTITTYRPHIDRNCSCTLGDFIRNI